jgi:aminoglycoside phosphotransferase (APT) family kinase protein
VICHNDFAPYNHVFRDGRFVGAIDYDICYPAPRLWDIAYTTYRYVPLTPPRVADVEDGPGADRSPFDLAQVRGRLALFFDAYAAASPGLRYPAEAAVTMVIPRLIAMAEWCAEQLDRPSVVQNGVMYRAHAEWLAGGGLDADSAV